MCLFLGLFNRRCYSSWSRLAHAHGVSNAGRAISLPARANGGAQALALATGAYARVRKQFNQPIGNFEGVEDHLARIAGNTYIIDAS